MSADVGNGMALSVGGVSWEVISVSGFGAECASVDTTTHADKGSSSSTEMGQDWSSTQIRTAEPGSVKFKPPSATVAFKPENSIPVTGAATTILLTFYPDTTNGHANVVGATPATGATAEAFVTDWDVSIDYDSPATATLSWEWRSQPTFVDGT